MKLRNYDGVSVIRLGRAPTSSDYGRIPTLWVDETNKNAYMLVHVADDGTTQWDKFASVTYVDNTVATVSGNINSFLEMTDTPNSYTNNSLLYVTSSGIEYTSSDITWDGTSLDISGPVSISGSDDTLFKVSNTEGSIIDVNQGGNVVITTTSGHRTSASSESDVIIKHTSGISNGLSSTLLDLDMDVQPLGDTSSITGLETNISTYRGPGNSLNAISGYDIYIDHDGDNDVSKIHGGKIGLSSNGEGNVTDIIGVWSSPRADGWDYDSGVYIGSPGVVTNMYGIEIYAFASGGASVSNMYGVKINDPESNAPPFRDPGTIGNNYGLYIENFGTTHTTGETYALYVEGQESYFGGNITTSGVFNMPSNPPATAGAAGTRGDIAWDADYIYVCVADNTWKRSSLSSW